MGRDGAMLTFLTCSSPIQESEVPDDKAHHYQSRQINTENARRHQGLSIEKEGRKKRSRLALLTTVTELKAMAEPAMTGDRRIPKTG